MSEVETGALGGGRIESRELEQEMRTSFLDYAMSVIVSRALPDVRDGLKPVHRRILYAMFREGLLSSRRYSKCAGVVGEVLKKYHPHGDASVYDALVRLAQEWNIRYLESRRTKIAEELLADIDADTVDFRPNFDESTEEPVVLPSRVPNLLVNGAAGIAVGMATNIPPHNLGEVIDATLHLIDNPKATVEDLMRFVTGPDFPTGAMILGRAGIAECYRTGRGSIRMRAKAEIEEDTHGGQRILVSELPFQTSVEAIGVKIGDLVNDRRIEGIRAVTDLSAGDTVGLVVDLKRDANAQVVLNQLYKHTPMQTNFAANVVALVDGVPRLLNLRMALEVYVAHQIDVVTRRSRYR